MLDRGDIPTNHVEAFNRKVHRNPKHATLSEMGLKFLTLSELCTRIAILLNIFVAYFLTLLEDIQLLVKSIMNNPG